MTFWEIMFWASMAWSALMVGVVLALWYRADRRSAARHAADVEEFSPARADYPYSRITPRPYLKYWHDVRIERDKLHMELFELRKRLHSDPALWSGLTTLGEVFHQASKEKGFWEDWEHYTARGRPGAGAGMTRAQREWIGNQLLMIHAEASEAAEALRDGKLRMYLGPDGKPEGLEVEVMDGVLRALGLLVGIGLDPAKAAKAKHAYNLTRPRLHGRQS